MQRIPRVWWSLKVFASKFTIYFSTLKSISICNSKRNYSFYTLKNYFIYFKTLFYNLPNIFFHITPNTIHFFSLSLNQQTHTSHKNPTIHLHHQPPPHLAVGTATTNHKNHCHHQNNPPPQHTKSTTHQTTRKNPTIHHHKQQLPLPQPQPQLQLVTTTATATTTTTITPKTH